MTSTIRSVPASATPPSTGGLAEPVFTTAARHPDRAVVARLTDGEWCDVSAAEFAAHITRVARGLVGAGIGPKDRVAILADNRYEWTLLDYALWSVGAIPVPVYPSSSTGQIRWILEDSAAVACVTDTAERAEKVRSATADRATPPEVWVLDEGAIEDLQSRGAEIAESAVRDRRAAVVPADPATLVYTSGTTGAPKGCVLTHANFFAEVDNIIAALPELFADGPGGSRPATLLFLPLAHVFGRVVQVCAMHAGVRLAHTASVRSLLTDLTTFGPTFLLAVPYVLEKIHAGAKARSGGGLKGRIFDAATRTAVAYSEALDTGGPGPLLRARRALFHRLVYVRVLDALGGNTNRVITGGGSLEARLLHFYRGMGLEVIEGYGLTETTAAVLANRPGRVRPGTVGAPLPGVSAALAEDGELLLKGPQVFQRYWNNEEATAGAFTDGWFATGDLGEFDDEGNLRIIGRKKEILVTAGGKNVVPGPMEERLRAQPFISQCMVLGDGRPFVTALVVLDPDTRDQLESGEQVRAAVQEAVDAANAEVSRAESIRAFTIVDTPFSEADETLTPTLKLRRDAVLSAYATEVEAMYTKR
ncbi:AMP-dependent synthetase/ligase [Nocardiopsis ansamitocini]|uniref:Long-chain-fatty-acid--CoA ligase n=1 Tax=Nocardiopsis ansamitocini TaxID=1670832 RepID=A0A9W6P2Q3_9ACTN|nr:long-chain fatty acid--CoA ligase [Nocardiopsis ansamitocini]GLU45953.1 long-chain-fatty-acid--CoA ligase [Nocardiopsis ansamitocini]